jgi:glycine/D-amino acid oxidase-like deaminating enzyme
MGASDEQSHGVIVGGGFAGIACARRLAEDDDGHVTLVDAHKCPRSQPLLHQVATSHPASSDIAYSLDDALALRSQSASRSPSRSSPPRPYLGVAAGVGEAGKALGALVVLGVNVTMLVMGGCAVLLLQRMLSRREARA